MLQPIRIDYDSVTQVATPAELAAMTGTGRHIVLQFVSLSREKKDWLISRLAAALPEHSVFESGGGPGRQWVTVMPVLARSRVIDRRYAILRAIVHYQRACKTLTEEYRKGRLSSEWKTYEHGEHCSFKNLLTGQDVEAPLDGSVEPSDIDPYFFARFVYSTAGLERVAELLNEAAARQLGEVF